MLAIRGRNLRWCSVLLQELSLNGHHSEHVDYFVDDTDGILGKQRIPKPSLQKCLHFSESC